MKKITLLLMAIGLSATMGFAQGKRIVCDETCRSEYQKTETSAQKQAETAKAATTKPAVLPGLQGSRFSPCTTWKKNSIPGNKVSIFSARG